MARNFRINRLSQLFQPITAVQKNIQAKTSEITSKSQRLMLDMGIIKQSSPGSFHYLPLGVRSVERLVKMVDEEMAEIDAQKVMFPTLTLEKLWKKTGRFDEVNTELFKLRDRHNIPYILSPTHEESATDLLASMGPISYKQYPIRLYQITNKYRDEMKPRFGLMRARQFIMKDLYTFDTDVENARRTYETVCSAYDRLFNRIGVKFVRVLGASGNMGGTISHEYHFVADVGEDEIMFCSNCGYKANLELGEADKCPSCEKPGNIQIKRGIEVGHTFLLGNRYSKPLKATFLASDSKPQVLQMGSYGLGISRIIAAGLESLSLEHEIRWPRSLAPFLIVIISPKEGSKEEASIGEFSKEIYTDIIQTPGLKDDVLLDDRGHMTIGRRVLDAKRTGYPYIIVVGTKAMENQPLFEVIDTLNNKVHYLSREQLLHFFTASQESESNKCN